MTAEALGQPGQVIDGKYRIIRLLGTGGMGAVYEGENIRIRRKVAIKMLHGSVSSQADVVMRFEREAQAAALVGSDHICEVLDLGELPDTTRYMVMEYLDGETLSGRIKRMGRLHPTQSIPILVQILEALSKAHAAGIIHRDLKPDNVFILPNKGGIQNFVKILDFGVSKFSQLGGEAMNVTRAGAVVGTPYYMSPEQARGTSAIDQRTDIYAIGVLLYQATTGQVPYQAETFNELLFKIVLEVAPPPQTYAPDLDPEFASIISRAMAREPEQRFQTCKEFADALTQYQNARAVMMPMVPQQQRGGPAPARTEILDLAAFNAHQQAWGNASAAGAQGMGASTPGMAPMGASMPGMNPGMNASMPGMQPGPNGSGANWQAASGAGGQMATANSWGNASGTEGVVAKPKSKGPLIGIIAAVVVLGGGTAAALMFMGKPGKTNATGGADTAMSATPPPVTASAAPPPVTASAAPPPPVTATASAAPPPTPPPTATAQAVKPVPGPAPGPKPGPGKAPPGKTAAPGPGKPPKPGKSGGDLGY